MSQRPLTPPAGQAAASPAASRPYPRDLLLYTVMLFAWVGIWRVQDIFPILGKIQFPLLVELGTLALFIMDKSPIRRMKWIKSPVVTVTFVLLAIMILGLPFSLWMGKGIDFLMRDFAPSLILMLLLAATLRDFADLEWFAFAHLVGGVGYAVYVFLYCPIGYDGRLGNLVYYDANDFGLLMGCTIPFAVYFLRPKVAVWRRLFALASIGLFAIMIMKSGSRGGFLGLIAVMLYTLLRYQAVPARLRIGAVGAGVAVFAIFGSARYWTLMGTILHPDDDYNMTEETGRKAVWKRGMTYMETHPLLGVGIHAFPQAEGTLSPTAKRYAEMGRGIKWSVAHNSFVEVGAECGVLAFALFIFRFLLMFWMLGRIRPPPRGKPYITSDDQAYAQMLIAAFIGFVVSGIFVSAEYFAFLYMLLGLVVAQQAVLKRRALAARRAPAMQPAAQARPVVRQPTGVQWLPAGS
jgi:O-antigen ligase